MGGSGATPPPREPRPATQAIELRVHGVGGAQGPKMLGLTTGADVETMAAELHNGKQTPPDSSSRFVRPLVSQAGRPQLEAYEWGALTAGSGWNALWTVFLPFTLLNVGGWARGGNEVRRAHRTVRDIGPRLLGYLGTVTYVVWLGYIFLELMGTQWQARLAVAKDTRTATLGREWLPPAVVVAFLVVLMALAWANERSGRKFEDAMPDRPRADDPIYPQQRRRDRWSVALRRYDRLLRLGQIVVAGALGASLGDRWTTSRTSLGHWVPTIVLLGALGVFVIQRIVMPEPLNSDEHDRGQPPQHWDDAETATHRNFFAHARSIGRLRHRHLVVGATTAGFVLWLAWAGRDADRTKLGFAIVLLATIQVAVLVLVWIVSLFTRRERFTRAGLVTLGTVLCHAVFAGFALWLRARLATIPGGARKPVPLAAGPELGLNDRFFIALLVIAGLLVVAATFPALAREHAGTRVVRVARRLPLIGVGGALAFVATFAVFSIGQAIVASRSGDPCASVGLIDRTSCWYDHYDIRASNALQSLGSKVLLLLPVAIALSLKSGSTVGRVIGNLWDVLTFWPRRYQPFAVPPYAERAVPELRRRIETHLEHHPVIVAGHSQGSVLSVAAVGPLLPAHRDRLFLLSFGSPLGTLYVSVFPTAIGRAVLDDVRGDLRRGEVDGWRVLWRLTDPIGGPIFGDDAVDVRIADPPPGASWSPPGDAAQRPPLDRPPPWGVVRGHGWYPAEPEYRQAVTHAVRSFGLEDPPGG